MVKHNFVKNHVFFIVFNEIELKRNEKWLKNNTETIVSRNTAWYYFLAAQFSMAFVL